ncbi:YciI family protein [Brachybacterium tyrofermentans]|uniref:YciI family protein n=1 Tax=Brachybacterium tyrofermentans TaxID=47848 RepID=UPI001868BB05|nr:YciI family protein [Brachybacterium tyrofermentans]
MARYTVFLYHPTDQATTDPEVLASQMAEHDAHGKELMDEGVMIFGSPLEDHDATTSIRADSLVDGPFVEVNEVIVGFYVIEVPDLDAAIAVARRNPIIHQGGGVEVRPMSAEEQPGVHGSIPA